MDRESDADPYASHDKGDTLATRGYFRLPVKEERRVALNFKVPLTLKLSLSALQRMWRLRAQAQGATDDDVKDIDLTFVCNELLAAGIDGAWDEAGKLAGLSGAPLTDEEWKALEAALRAQAAATK